MLLTIESSNEGTFSWLVAKNPATQTQKGKPFEKPLKKGRIFCWFSNPKKLTLLFKDSRNISSFSDEAFEYLDKTRYAAPAALLGMMDEMLRSAEKGEFEDKFPAPATYLVKIPTLLVASEKVLNAMISHARDLQVDATRLAGKVWSLTISHTGALSYVLGWVRLLALMQSLQHGESLPASQIERYAGLIQRLDAPYFVRYLFSRNVLNERGSFQKSKEALESPTVKLCFGDTRQQRHDAAKTKLKGGEVLVDIGCGEGWHAVRLSKLYEQVLAFDLDEAQIESNRRFAERRNLDKLTFAVGLHPDEVRTSQPIPPESDVLMFEVVEHMPQDTAEALVLAVLDQAPRQVLVTVPNKTFNQHYALADDETRHPDHAWEPTRDEFQAWCEKMAETKGYQVAIEGIGDSVAGDHLSLLAEFTVKA